MISVPNDAATLPRTRGTGKAARAFRSAVTQSVPPGPQPPDMHAAVLTCRTTGRTQMRAASAWGRKQHLREPMSCPSFNIMAVVAARAGGAVAVSVREENAH
ncbi:MAG: hypothetical protein JOZ72_04360 [Alphaproteobacteria bacterium]|nr:hypothetical protein [Alphaproteobacteria bacterium]